MTAKTGEKMTVNKQSGLSIIELMIAMVVGLILIAGVLSIFLSSRKSYGVNSAVARVQQNARFSLDYIRTATRMAGYMGCGNSSTTVSYVDSNALPYDFSQAITGFNYNGTDPNGSYSITAENPAVSTSGWTPTLDASLPAMIPGSDVLVVRYSSGNVDPAYVTGSSGADINFDQAPDFKNGDFLLISNCVNSFVIQADHVNGSNVVVNSGNDATPGNTIHGLPFGDWVGSQGATARTTAFYIGQGADGSPSLFEATTGPSGFTSQELVPGVENMQVLYGEDTADTSAPSAYVTANNVSDWNSVVSVRVALLLRSDPGAVTLPPAAATYDLLGTAIAAPRDTRLRRVFTSTIMLRNR